MKMNREKVERAAYNVYSALIIFLKENSLFIALIVFMKSLGSLISQSKIPERRTGTVVKGGDPHMGAPLCKILFQNSNLLNVACQPPNIIHLLSFRH